MIVEPGMKKTKSKVAVVDNDAAILRALERLLRAYGYSAELYSSAEEFLDRESANDIGCLILDINLGGISGIELQRKLLSLGHVLPVIFITSDSAEYKLKQVMKIGCIAYLKKPFTSHALIQALTRAVAAV